MRERLELARHGQPPPCCTTAAAGSSAAVADDLSRAGTGWILSPTLSTTPKGAQMDAWSLSGKVMLITGGARGIGAATARELARRGALPVLADLDIDALAATAAAISPTPVTVELDVTDLDACEAAVQRVLEEHGRLDVVWANAGIGSGGPLQLTDPAAWRRTVEVNLLGAYNTIRTAYLPGRASGHGHRRGLRASPPQDLRPQVRVPGPRAPAAIDDAADGARPARDRSRAGALVSPGVGRAGAAGRLGQ